MAEFSVIMKQAKRMCKTYESCFERCPFGQSDGCPFVFFKHHLATFDFSEIERIVMDWAAKNPEPRYPSWNGWFRETFPDSIYATSPCPNTFCRVCDPTAYHGEVECYECKGKPIPADVAEKLNIKPIGG